MSQTDEFYMGEGDAWFGRNKDALEKLNLQDEMEPLLSVLRPFMSKVTSILEIGSSDGRRLEYLCNQLDSKGVGLDPSFNAVRNGNERLKRNLNDLITLQHGDARSLPYTKSEFDLVLFGFCLYLIDRDHLNEVVQEANRVLKKGGFLLIFDFDVLELQTVPYLHKSGINTYKDDYQRYFLELGNYHLVSKISFGHRGLSFQIDKAERIAYWVLYKEFE